eukprot:TRINITY_DN4848_c0_g1_i1.p1 TRINITY_DN4848_c0_g1~~TRINITY_DN4848_c0_g1_i1.p1  ORF type:complete len:560 (-),score=56.11 TRINITY_DN4848_c0_g1_i1:31-1710(-)
MDKGCLLRCSGVLIEVCGPDRSEKRARGRPFSITERGNTVISGSGFVWDRDGGVIVTTATVVAPFTSAKITEFQPMEAPLLLKTTEISVLYEGLNDDEITRVQAELVEIKTVKGISSALKNLVGDSRKWRVGWNVPDPDEASLQSLLPFMDKIAVLRVDPLRLRAHVCSISDRISATPRKSQPVTFLGSPFGLMSPKALMNNLTTGVVSNLIKGEGKDVPLFLTDARCFAGMEGGLALDSEGNFLGVLIPPLRKLNSNIEFNFVISASHVIAALKGEEPSTRTLPAERVVSEAEKYLVLVSIGHSWASGFLISSAGHILTNAHLLRPFLLADLSKPSLQNPQISARVRIYMDGAERWFDADIMFVTDATSHVDAALLKVKGATETTFAHVDSAISRRHEIRPGQAVAVLGYPVFNPEDLRPTFTAGIISKVVRNNGAPALIITNAPVHEGNSGGILLSSDGIFLGMVTSNARETGSKEVIPRINFTIPFAELLPFFDFVSGGSDDIQVLEAVNRSDDVQRQIVQLRLRPKDERPPDQKNQQSKFLQFVKDLDQKQQSKL